MSDNLKKYWFVALVAVIFIGGIGYYAIDQYNSVFKGKNTDGKSVVAEIAGQDIFTDTYYDQLYEASGINNIASLFEKTVFSKMELTTEMKEKAKTASDNVYNNYASQGQSSLDTLGEQLRQLGYSGIDDLTKYFEDYEKRMELIRSYLKENPEAGQTFIDENNSMIVSHILVSSDTPTTPTEAETKKMNDIDAALAAGDAFGDVAKEYSNDQGTALKNGLVGYVDKNTTTYYKVFTAEANKLSNVGDTSDWFISEAPGFHKIYVTANDLDSLLEEDAFLSAYASKNSTTISGLVWEKAEELGVTFTSEDVEKEVKEALGIKEATE